MKNVRRLILIIVLTWCAGVASAYDTEVDGIYYDLYIKAKMADVTSGDVAYKGDVTIPSSITVDGVTYEVTGIDDDAFRSCYNLLSVSLPNTIVSIGEDAFAFCRSLSSVHIPNSVWYIGDYAFSGCSQLVSVDISSSVTKIGDYAFVNCSALKEVSIPISLQTLPYGTFSGCSSLESVSIPNSVKSIGSYAFSKCASLKKVDIPNSVQSIEHYAFENCSALAYINIPSSVTSLYDGVFNNCKSLNVVVLGSNIRNIGAIAFSNCKNLEQIYCQSTAVPNTSDGAFNFSFVDFCKLYVPRSSVESYQDKSPWSDFGEILPIEDVEIPQFVDDATAFHEKVLIGDIYYNLYGRARRAEVTSGEMRYKGDVVIPETVSYEGVTYNVIGVEGEAFYNCNGMSSVSIPGSVVVIGNNAFGGCSGLLSVTIPEGVKHLGANAFASCSRLKSVTLPSSINSIRVSAFSYCNELEYIDIPNSVTTIEPYAFSGCIALTSINLPNSISVIESNLFYGCTNLRSIDIPHSVTNIGSYSFAGCTSLPYVNIPESVKNIQTEAFLNCSSLTTVVLGNGLKSIREKAFANCKNLENVYCQAENIPRIYANTFELSFVDCSTLYVPGETMEDYESDAAWSEFGSIMPIDEVVIPESADGLAILPKVTVDGITYNLFRKARRADVTTGEERYSGDVVIPSSIEVSGVWYDVVGIDEGAFEYCTNLQSVTLPHSITSIGNEAFASCYGLTSVDIPNSVTSIGESVFSWCHGLQSVTIPNSVTSMGSQVFYDCRNLSSVSIPNSLSQIPSYTFSGCTSLTSVNIPTSVTSIGWAAFAKCSNLKVINLPSSVTSVEGLSFSECTSLAFVTIPNSVTSIGYHAFYGCKHMVSLTLPASLRTIGDKAFSSCKNLEYLYCHSEQVPTTSSDAFELSLVNFSTLLVPSVSVELYSSTEPWNTFGVIKSLDDVEDPDTRIDGLYYRLYEKAKIAEVISGEIKYTGDIKVPSQITVDGEVYDVTGIGSDAFTDCSVTSVSLPNSIINIGDNAFQNCTEIKEMKLPESLVSMGEHAFQGCERLEEIDVPNSLAHINDYAFEGCDALTTVILHDALMSVGENAFGGCDNLEEVYCYSKNVPDAHVTAFDDSPVGDCTLYVPGISIDAYKSTEPWSHFGKILPIPGTEVEIVLHDGEEYDETEEKEWSRVRYIRNFTHTNWQALYVPFSMKYEDWCNDFEIAKLNDVHQFDDDDDGEVDRTLLEGIKIKKGHTAPNTPYLIRSKRAGEKEIHLSDVTVFPAEENSFDVTNWDLKFTFIGTYREISGITMRANGYYAMGDGKLRQASSDSNHLSAYRWYLVITDRYGAPKKSRDVKVYIRGEEDATGIEMLKDMPAPSPVHEFFDLKGQRVTSPEQTGVYIRNGNKFIVK